MVDRIILMNKRGRFLLTIIFIFTFFTTTFSQTNPVKPKIIHKIFFGFFGYGYNKFFDGLAPNGGYEVHFNKNYISATFHGFQQLTFGDDPDPQEVIGAYLLFNRDLISKPVIVSVGAGVAYNSVTTDIKNFIQPSPADYYTSAQITRSIIGLPLNLNISLPTRRKLSTGINFHSDFNSFVNFYSANIFLSYKFQKPSKQNNN